MSAEKQRITWLCLEWPRRGEHVGGVGRYCQRLAREVRHQVELSVVAFEGAEPMEGVRVETVAAATSRFYRYYISPLRARAAVRATKPQVVHSHGDDWLLNHRVPKVRSFYGSALHEARSSRGLRKVNHYLLAATEKLSQHGADVRIGIAPESEKQFACEILMPPYLRSDPAPRRPSDVPTGMFVGDFAGRKRGWQAQAAWEGVRREDARARLIVVGPAGDRGHWAEWVEHVSSPSDDEFRAALGSAWSS